jgi:hypothetical protein
VAFAVTFKPLIIGGFSPDRLDYELLQEHASTSGPSDDEAADTFAMADKVQRDSGLLSNSRRAATDPAQPSVAGMDDRTSQERETPRVRFSEDLDRATESATAGQRSGTPSLMIDTSSRPNPSIEAPAAPTGGILPKKTNPSLTPTSPRTRDRGYSLRRSLFARGINNQSENIPIELVEAAPPRASRGSRREEGKRKQSPSEVTISPLVENDFDVSTIDNGAVSLDRSPPKEMIRRHLVPGVCQIMLLGQASVARRTPC